MHWSLRFSRISLLLLIASLVTAPSHSNSQDAKASEPTLEELILDLGNSTFAIREKAGDLLWKRGRAAIPALEKAVNDPSPEVSRRAREILDTFGWYIFPDTPPDVLKAITAFRTARANERKAAFAELLKLGKHGHAAARSILLKQIPTATRQPLVEHLTAHLRREVPLLLFDKKIEEAAELLSLHAVGTTPEGAADFAALQVLRDKLPSAIAEAEAARKTARSEESAELILAHLYRANRDWAKAHIAAANLPTPPNGSKLVDMLREEEGDWTALLNAPPPDLNLPAAYRLTFLRLAGRQKEFQDNVKQVRDAAAEYTLSEDIQDAAFSLLVNNRAIDATDLLLKKRQNLGLLSEILIGRLKFKEALELIGENQVSRIERLEFDLRHARILAITGRREDAVKLFGEVAEKLRTNSTRGGRQSSEDIPRTQRALLRSELRVGFRDLACDHAALFVVEPGNFDYRSDGETVFELMFGPDAAVVETLFRTLRTQHIPGDEAGLTMRLTRDLLNGTVPQAIAERVVKVFTEESLEEIAGGRSELNSAANRKRLTRLAALAVAYRIAGRFLDAERTFAEVADAAAESPESLGARSWVFGTSDASRPWLDFADFLYERGRFADAAVKFEAGWRRFPDQPLLLFLSGRAFAKAGNIGEGKRRMELAHWVSLGNERVRGKFLEELIRRGEVAAAKRETDLLLRACWSRDFFFGNVMNQAARASAMAKDWTTAERCVQRSLLVLIKAQGAHFLDTAAYLNVPHEMLIYRARGLLAAGKVDEAMVQARACLDVTPGLLDLVNGMVPELDKLGRKKEADELFGRVWEAYRKVLSEYPASPSARNALASLGAGCQRELDQSLIDAKEAVAADPWSVSFRETLAEVHFRRGERAAALEIMSKLAAEFPRSRLYRRQLPRYKSGELGSAIPEIEE